MEWLRSLKSRKGVLLTLTSVVLIVLIISEITTYIYTNIQYTGIAQQSTPGGAASYFYTTVQSGMVPFLRSSLTASIKGLAAYEANNATVRINDTQFAITSLMTNGQVYGANMITYMGNYTLSAYVAQLQSQAKSQNLNLSISNGTLLVFQDTPYNINVSYYGLAVISSSGGTITYPIDANASISLQGTPDLLGAVSGTPSQFQYTTSSNVVVAGGSTASQGSSSPYLFTYGPLFFDPNNAVSASCSDSYISNAVSTTGSSLSQYILVAPNSVNVNSIVCGFAGLITSSVNSITPLKPYLVYKGSSSNILGYTSSGIFIFNLPQGRYILGGGSLSLADPTPLESAIQNQYYTKSGFSPSYLELSSGYLNVMSPFGVAPLGILDRQVGTFNQNEYASVSNVPVNTLSGAYTTVSFWMQVTNPSLTSDPIAFSSNTYSIVVGGLADMIGISTGTSTSNVIGVSAGDEQYLYGQQWVHVGAVFYNGVPTTSNIIIYLNGVRQTLSSSGTPSNSVVSKNIIFGLSNTASNVQLADVQVYNSLLSPYQIESLYLGGIDAPPVTFANLSGWWPLNGNLNDYSRQRNNGTIVKSTNAAYFNRLSNYQLDLLEGGSAYVGMASRVDGISQCYAIANCSYGAPGQLYVTLPAASSYSSNSIDSPGGYLGLLNNTIPGDAVFDYAQNSSIVVNNVPLTASGYTISLWMNANAISTSPETAAFIGTPTGGILGIGLSSGCLGPAMVGTNFNVVGVNAVALYQNKWINVIAKIQPGSSLSSSSSLYINGVAQTLLTSGICSSGTVSSTTPNTVYIGSQPGISSIGQSAPFAGSIADVQIYNSLLSANQVYDLYLNNSVPGTTPSVYVPLGSGYNGYLNQTYALVTNTIKYGYAKKGNSLCLETNSISAIGNQCGVEFVPHEIPGT